MPNLELMEPCKTCEKEISIEARRCPNCGALYPTEGFKQKKEKENLFGMMGAGGCMLMIFGPFILIVLVVIASSC